MATSIQRDDGLHRPLFIALALSLAGWGFLTLWLVQVHAGYRMYLVAAVFALWIVFLSIPRPRIGADTLPGSANGKVGAQRALRPAAAGWVLLLLAIGAGLGNLVLLASFTPLFFAAVVLASMPWQRVQFCRDHTTAACTAMLVGMALMTAPNYRRIASLFLPLTWWAFWAGACVSLLLRIDRMSRAARRAKAIGPMPAVDTSARSPTA
jgi:hypothetical protein